MDLSQARDFIASVGFPIGVAIYLLVYFRKSIDSLKDAINLFNDNQVKLTALIDKLCDKINSK